MNGHGWEAIRAEVLRRIRVRDWPPGALIPKEEVLAVEFGCARATVNRALRDLAEAGILERKRKAGTRVAALPVRKATLDIPVIRQEVEARGCRHSHLLLVQAENVLPAPVAARLGLPAGAQMLYLETLHLADARPFAFETRWLNPDVLPSALPDFAAISVNEWLVSNIAYVSGDIAFCAEAATAREAEVLQVPPASALFIIERTTWATAPITLVRLAHGPGYAVRTLV